MAIDIDVQNDKFPYLARQISGDIAEAFGYGIDHVYEKDLDFLNFLSHFGIDNLEGKWLDMLGIILGLPRPYTSKLTIDRLFEFDTTHFVLDGQKHGFSTSSPITIDGVQYDRNDGGFLDNIISTTEQKPVSDSIYKSYLTATSLLKQTHSLQSIAEVIQLFVDTTRFAILFRNGFGYVNDISIVLSATSADYQESLQKAFNTIFTTPPFVIVTVSLFFDDIYTIPEISKIIEEVTGSDTGYTVTYAIRNKITIFTITLSSALAEYETAIKNSLEARFAGTNDVRIVVVVE